MREHPWHIRRATAEHHQWYRNLVDLHALTQSWLRGLQEIGRPKPEHSLKRWHAQTSQEEIEDTLWILESLEQIASSPNAGAGLEALLDDTLPEDLLSRLEHTVWAVQASTLSAIIEATPEKERSALRNQLEQSSWKSGRQCASQRWPDLEADARGDLRGILAAYRDAPLSGWPRNPGWLVQRAVSRELRLDLTGCPHQNRYLEVRSAADELCALHTQWTRGFIYELNTRVAIDHTRPQPSGRCHQRWYFLG